MDDTALGRVAASGFLQKNLELTEGLTEFLNKAQKVSSLAVLACTGATFEVREILANKLIESVAKSGPQVIAQVIGVIDSQLDAALEALTSAFEEAAKAMEPSTEDAATVATVAAPAPEADDAGEVT